jgi:hypothetical protein
MRKGYMVWSDHFIGFSCFGSNVLQRFGTDRDNAHR